MGVSSQFLKLRSSSDAQSSRTQDNTSATLTPIATALNATPLMGTAPMLTPSALSAGFANLGAPYQAAQYYKDSLWRVWSVGVLVCAAGCAAGTAVLTFPQGLRPSSVQRKAVEGFAGAVNFISIAPTGVCTVEVGLGAGDTVDVDFSFLAQQ